jgi:hypothetical protein
MDEADPILIFSSLRTKIGEKTNRWSRLTDILIGESERSKECKNDQLIFIYKFLWVRRNMGSHKFRKIDRNKGEEEVRSVFQEKRRGGRAKLYNLV